MVKDKVSRTLCIIIWISRPHHNYSVINLDFSISARRPKVLWVSGIVLLPFLIAWCIQPFFCVGETPKDPLRFKRMTLTLKKEKEGTFSCCIEQRMQRIRFFRMLLQSVWKAEKLIWLGFSNCIWEFHAFWILIFLGTT